MLTIHFSHIYCKMPPGGIRPGDCTTLLNYCVVDKLSPQFREYDTRYYPGPHQYAIAKDAQFYPLPETGPYLILFLKTVQPPCESWPEYWTTVRRPWCRMKKGPGWVPVVPEKYRRARGKLVNIVVEE